ncbi:MAG: sigma 54-interacting transcriptional regulator, partial [Phyllobacteriaceae bacterium]|nr:sigma 54-interacting transcriptional regulator [Phyllobacteriaceae bacterium]
GIERLVTTRGRTCFARPHATARPIVAGARSPRPADERPVGAASANPPSAPRPRTGEIVWDDGRRRALTRTTRLLDAEVPVLIQGETGTGKEVFARALHAASRRADRPFVAVNCAALPEGLIEAELFGYEEGAFTGARRKGSKGLMREAEGGVLFLDEIGDMPVALQARLLRALEQREVTPLGGGRAVPVDFALICATHMGLVEAVERRAFRQDLYFRIAQYTVELEPLRAHPDLGRVVERLWSDHAAGTGARLAPATLERLCRFDWPGNYRQLTATLRTLAILAEPGETLGVETLPADLRRAPRSALATEPPARLAPPVDAPSETTDLAGLTRSAMREALAASGGNVTRAAARLGVHRSTLYRRVLADDARA